MHPAIAEDLSKFWPILYDALFETLGSEAAWVKKVVPTMTCAGPVKEDDGGGSTRLTAQIAENMKENNAALLARRNRNGASSSGSRTSGSDEKSKKSAGGSSETSGPSSGSPEEVSKKMAQQVARAPKRALVGKHNPAPRQPAPMQHRPKPNPQPTRLPKKIPAKTEYNPEYNSLADNTTRRETYELYTRSFKIKYQDMMGKEGRNPK
ncbi:hypothetical protein BU26DRAFT_234404 [Trematosphaeria pertusa]|uniref:Uncharacterized protein n=1 Tax=Trematosphaeria pertusa TaxID=390896 RepID=A0A6A6IU22_9PLEO|nr:uncharacterized protein BU26DRAFT_234404 [Trematosphaeria pertusa]KAF2254041.1 hypothetical protein BU26DRAFT_234404 [Trematosphaeria pertusa]